MPPLDHHEPQPKPVPKAPIDPKTGMPAASAGTNGSFTPPSPAERKRVYTATHPVGGNDSALLLNRTALAPPSAPDPIRAMISAANLIVGQPYRWGGGHGSFQSKGYDCSGAVSYALAGAGLLQTPLTSGQFMGYGDARPRAVADDLREPQPRLRGDRRSALGHRGGRARLGPPLASLRRISERLRRPARPGPLTRAFGRDLDFDGRTLGFRDAFGSAGGRADRRRLAAARLGDHGDRRPAAAFRRSAPAAGLSALLVDLRNRDQAARARGDGRRGRSAWRWSAASSSSAARGRRPGRSGSARSSP